MGASNQKHGFLLPFHSLPAREALGKRITEATALPDVLSDLVCGYTLHSTSFCSTQGGAFAFSLANGRVVTWGNADYGGDSSAVQGELKDQVE